MIYTVTFNPSIDYIVNVDNFMTGVVNRTSKENGSASGTYVNMSCSGTITNVSTATERAGTRCSTSITLKAARPEAIAPTISSHSVNHVTEPITVAKSS